MTKKEFNATGFTGGMKALYNGKEYDVANADFEKFTIGLTIDDGKNIIEVACEDVTFTRL